jgi:hypothetical protein
MLLPPYLDAAYEWSFWTVVGVTTATGVSHLGPRERGLLGPHTGSGTAFTVKPGSAVRAVAVVGAQRFLVHAPSASVSTSRVRAVVGIL